MTLSLSWATFLPTKLFFAFYSLQHHAYIRHRRDYDEQKAVVVVKHHYRGYEKTRNVLVRRSISEALVTYVQVRLRLIF